MSLSTLWRPQRGPRDGARRRLAWGLGVAVLHGAVLAGLWWGDRSTWVSVATGACCTAGAGPDGERVSVLWVLPDGPRPLAAPLTPPVTAPVTATVPISFQGPLQGPIQRPAETSRQVPQHAPVPVPDVALAGSRPAPAAGPVRRAGPPAATRPDERTGDLVAATAVAVAAAGASPMGTMTATAAPVATPGTASGAQGPASAAPEAMAMARPAMGPPVVPAQPVANKAPAATVAARMLPGNPLPVYPEAAREDGLQGTVYLEVQLDARGQVLDVHWRQRSGVLLLDQAARDAVRQWRFEPARRAGEAVPAALRVAIHFRLAEPVAVASWAEARWP